MKAGAMIVQYTQLTRLPLKSHASLKFLSMQMQKNLWPFSQVEKTLKNLLELPVHLAVIEYVKFRRRDIFQRRN
jgi:hypothetical protein